MVAPKRLAHERSWPRWQEVQTQDPSNPMLSYAQTIHPSGISQAQKSRQDRRDVSHAPAQNGALLGICSRLSESGGLNSEASAFEKVYQEPQPERRKECQLREQAG